MINDDLKTVEEIYTIVSNGIEGGYESFKFHADVFEGYIETTLIVSNNGIETDSPATSFNGALLYRCIKTLHKSFSDRGESWKSFMMTHTIGSQVKTHFKYPED